MARKVARANRMIFTASRSITALSRPPGYCGGPGYLFGVWQKELSSAMDTDKIEGLMDMVVQARNGIAIFCTGVKVFQGRKWLYDNLVPNSRPRERAGRVDGPHCGKTATDSGVLE